MQYPGWDQVADGFFAFDHQSVPGIIAALKSNDQIRLGSQEINDLAFALITPLSADYDHICHVSCSIQDCLCPIKSPQKGWKINSAGGLLLPYSLTSNQCFRNLLA
jgi:hypothetical protein